MFLLRSTSSEGVAGGPACDADSPEARRQQFDQYVAVELSGLRERLLAKFDQGLPLPASSRRSTRAFTNGSAGAGEAAAAAARASSPPRHSQAGFAGLDLLDPSAETPTAATASIAEDNVQSARSEHSSRSSEFFDTERTFTKDSLPMWLANWSRLIGKIVRSSGGDTISVAELTMRVLPAQDAESSDEEEPWREHADWLKGGSKPGLMRVGTHFSSSGGSDSGRMSTFAASLVANADTGEEYGRLGTPTMLMTMPVYGRSTIVKKLMVHPDSARRYIWALFGAILLMWDAVTIPLESVDLLRVSHAMVIVGFSYWSFDILIQSCTGYMSEGRLEMRFKKTARRYAKTWLPLDLGVLALDAVFSFLLADLNSSARTIVLLRLLRLIRLARVRKWLSVVESFMRTNTSKLLDLVMKIGRLLLFILLMCHYVACAWYWVGLQGNVINWGVGGSWMDDDSYTHESMAHKYLLALHWSITQFTPATQNVVPHSTFERVFAVGVVLWGMLVFSVFLSSITATVNELKTLTRARTEARFRLVQFIKSKRIHANLGSVILMLFDADYDDQSRALVESDLPVLKGLPESVRIRMHREYFLPYLKLHPMLGLIFYVDNRYFLHISHEAMSDHRYLAQQEVFLEGVETTHAYIVVMGTLRYHKGKVAPGGRSGVSVFEDTWLAEAAMWVTWTHHGSLVARSCAELVKMDCDVIRRIALKASGPILSCMRCCAVLYAHQLSEARLEGGLTDMCLPEPVLDSIAFRALRFCSLDHVLDMFSVERKDRRSVTASSTASFMRSFAMFNNSVRFLLHRTFDPVLRRMGCYRTPLD